MSIFFTLALILLSDRFRGIKVLSHSLLIHDSPTARLPASATQIIYQILKLVGSKKSKSNVIINGVLLNHFEECNSENCKCDELFNEFDMEVQKNENVYEIEEA